MCADTTPDLLEQAADWQIRLAEDPNARPQFECWLAADPAHAQAWGRMQALWGALDELPEQVLPASSRQPLAVPELQALQPLGGVRRRRWPRVAAVSAVLALVVVLLPRASLYWQADYHTGVAETRQVQLADGSRVTLAPQSAIRLRSGTLRRVEVLKGQVYFQVAHDPQRPFVATAGPMAVRVLGTVFDLALHDGSSEVALEQGQVQAENADATASLKVSERLLPGDRLRVDWASGKLQRSRLDPTRVAAWREQVLYVEDQSVAEIVAQLQSYTGGWIMITDPQLAQRRISGVFDLHDPDRALQALARSLNVPHQQFTPWLRTLGNAL